MKLLIDSYNECFQNNAGGVRTKIEYFIDNIKPYCDVKLFDKWNDKISDYDIYHIFKPSIQNYSSIIYAKKLGIPIVISAVAQKEKGRTVLAKKIIDKLLPINTFYKCMKKIYQMSDIIIAETIYEKEFICKTYNIRADKIKVIPNGISIDYLKETDNHFKKKYGINSDFLLQVGRFDSNKNQLSTIKAIKDTDVNLVLIGGPDKDDLSYYEECKKNAGKNVYFIGWIDHNDPLLLSAYKECKAFILPSHNEILGNALIEAAACGANIISTNVLPLSDWGIDKMCMSIDPNNIDDIKRKIIKSMETDKNNELKKKVIELFDWKNVTKKHMNVYKGLISNEKN